MLKKEFKVIYSMNYIFINIALFMYLFKEILENNEMVFIIILYK